MLALWSYLGWSIVTFTGVAYVWLLFRVVLFPKPSPSIRRDRKQIRTAA